MVHVQLDGTGFRIGGRPVPPRVLAGAIAACGHWHERPVVVAAVGASAVREAATPLLSALWSPFSAPWPSPRW